MTSSFWKLIYTRSIFPPERKVDLNSCLEIGVLGEIIHFLVGPPYVHEKRVSRIEDFCTVVTVIVSWEMSILNVCHHVSF